MSQVLGFAIYSDIDDEYSYEGRSPRVEVAEQMAKENSECYGGRWFVINLANSEAVASYGE